MTTSEFDIDVSVVQLTGEVGTWAVEAIDFDNDGACFKAVFYGPNSEDRANEYARLKYGTH